MQSLEATQWFLWLSCLLLLLEMLSPKNFQNCVADFYGLRLIRGKCDVKHQNSVFVLSWCNKNVSVQLLILHQDLFHGRHGSYSMTWQSCQSNTWQLPRRAVPPSSVALCHTCPAVVSNSMILWPNRESVQLADATKIDLSNKMKICRKELSDRSAIWSLPLLWLHYSTNAKPGSRGAHSPFWQQFEFCYGIKPHVECKKSPLCLLILAA